MRQSVTWHQTANLERAKYFYAEGKRTCMLVDRYSLEKPASAFSHTRAWDDVFFSGLFRALSMHRGLCQMCSTHLPEFLIPVYIIEESDHIPSRTPERWKHSNEFPDRMSPTFPEQEIPFHSASRCCVACPQQRGLDRRWHAAHIARATLSCHVLGCPSQVLRVLTSTTYWSESTLSSR